MIRHQFRNHAGRIVQNHVELMPDRSETSISDRRLFDGVGARFKAYFVVEGSFGWGVYLRSDI